MHIMCRIYSINCYFSNIVSATVCTECFTSLPAIVNPLYFLSLRCLTVISFNSLLHLISLLSPKTLFLSSMWVEACGGWRWNRYVHSCVTCRHQEIYNAISYQHVLFVEIHYWKHLHVEAVENCILLPPCGH